MELLRIGDPLLRSRATPLLSFLTPSHHPSWRPSSLHQHQRTHPIKPTKQQRSSLHSTSPQEAQSSSSTADLDFLDDPPQQKSRRPPPSPPAQQNASDGMIDDLLNSTFDNLPNSSRRKKLHPKQSSAQLLEDSFKASNDYYNSPMRDRGTRAPGSLSGSMTFPDLTGTRTGDSGNGLAYNKSNQGVIGEARRAKRTIKPRPSVGRTVDLNPERDVDFGRALRTLEIQCAVNRVRADLQRQRFHERPGMKRKRLKSERWRKLFKESFRATVGRVNEMRRKGW